MAVTSKAFTWPVFPGQCFRQLTARADSCKGAWSFSKRHYD